VTAARVGSLLSKLERLLEPEPPPSVSPASAREQAVREAMAEMRKLLQRTGAAFGAGATLVLGGLGYAQLHEVFPLPANHARETALAALAGVVLAVGGSVGLAGAFFRAQRRILITPADEDDDIEGPDQALKMEMYDRVAMEESAPSLDALELRKTRFERMARTATSASLREELEAEAARVRDAYRWAMLASAQAILERRSRQAFQNSLLWALVGGAGIVLAFAAADYSKGERDRVALLRSCQEAVALGAEDACDSVRAKPSAREEAEATRDAQIEKRDVARALQRARRTFADPSKPRLVRLEACATVLGSVRVPDPPAAAEILRSCLKLTAGS
jgi:hypothetical protein